MSISTTELPHAVQVPAAVSTAAPPAAPAATDTDEPPMMPATPRLHTPHGHRDSVFAHLAQRLAIVKEHFPAALSAGDFLSRTEMALASCGFQGHNSIAVTNLCRDEATTLLKNKIDNIFGSSFNISGLGACITCGCLGMRAGFSHSPVDSGRERYVFFSMPHIGIAPDGIIGSIYRPGRAASSTACGALASLLSQFKGDRRAVVRAAAKATSSHAIDDPEITILRNKLASYLQRSRVDLATLYLPEFTKIAERVITADLEALIRETVDISTADYAVVTGVQVHSWPEPGSGEPLLEFVAPRIAYAVCGGVRKDLNLQNIPALTPRQLAVLRRCPTTVPAAADAGSTVVVASKIRGRE